MTVKKELTRNNLIRVGCEVVYQTLPITVGQPRREVPIAFGMNFETALYGQLNEVAMCRELTQQTGRCLFYRGS